MDGHRSGERRHIWHVAADDAEQIEEAAASGAAGLSLDLEDGVHPSGKVRARRNVAEFLAANPDVAARTVVRINQTQGSEWRADVDATCAVVETYLVPKLSTLADLRTLEGQLLAAERDNGLAEGSRRIYLSVETPGIAAELRAMAAKSPRISGLFGGQADLTLEVGCAGIAEDGGFVPSPTVQWAHTPILYAAAEFGIPAFISVWIPAPDREARVREMRRLFALGYHGMIVGSAAAVEDAEIAWRPTPRQVEFAEGVVAAFESAERAGKSTAQYEGWGMEPPHLGMARRLLSKLRPDEGGAAETSTPNKENEP
ncbi:MAG TPA: aldolase/citrate lyase family protein [Solirubrobacterales bacterium]|nr:aldolase/citrate lyase family protein [Solirubrobacterales bacterium]